MKENYAVGIGVNLFGARAVLSNSQGKAVIKLEEKIKSNASVNQIIQIIIKLADRILAKAEKYKPNIRGMGVALGGIIDNKKGVVFWPQKEKGYYTYISMPLKSYLEKKYKLSVQLENDANASCFYEYKTKYKSFKHLLYMFSGVGCGMLLDGKIYRGKDGSAGELFINYAKGLNTYFGNASFLTQWSIDLGMIDQAKELLSKGRNSFLIKKISSTGELSLKDIFKEADKGDSLAKEVAKKGAVVLGIKISFLVDLLNPQAVIIGGMLEDAPGLFFEELKKAVRRFSFSEVRKNLKIVPSSAGSQATSLGAAQLFF